MQRLVRLVAEEPGVHAFIHQATADQGVVEEARSLTRVLLDGQDLPEPCRQLCQRFGVDESLLRARLWAVASLFPDPRPLDHDPYEILGLEPWADSEEVKRAFRTLCLQWHPDRNPDDPEAATRFRRIKAAYDMVRDSTAPRDGASEPAANVWAEAGTRPGRSSRSGLRRLFPLVLVVGLLVLAVSFADMFVTRPRPRSVSRDAEPVRTAGIAPAVTSPETVAEDAHPGGLRDLTLPASDNASATGAPRATNASPASAPTEGVRASAEGRADAARSGPEGSEADMRMAVNEVFVSGQPEHALPAEDNPSVSAPLDGEVPRPVVHSRGVAQPDAPGAPPPARIERPQSEPRAEPEPAQTHQAQVADEPKPLARSPRASEAEQPTAPKPVRTAQTRAAEAAPVSTATPQSAPPAREVPRVEVESAPQATALAPTVGTQSEPSPRDTPPDALVPEPAAVQEPPAPAADPAQVALAEAEARLEQFLSTYVRDYCRRDLPAFLRHFAPGARENGTRLEELRPLYAESFRDTPVMSYSIAVDGLTFGGDTVRLAGRFEMRGAHVDGRPLSSRGSLVMDLAPHGPTYLVRNLEYSFR